MMPRKYFSSNRLGKQKINERKSIKKKQKKQKKTFINAGNNTGEWSSKNREEHATDSRAIEVCSRGSRFRYKKILLTFTV